MANDSLQLRDLRDVSKITAEDVRYEGEKDLRLRVVVTLSRKDGSELVRYEKIHQRFRASGSDPITLREAAVWLGLGCGNATVPAESSPATPAR